MRSYSMIFPTFWTGKTGRELKKLGKDCQILAMYLLTSPNAMSNMGLGIYYLPLVYISHDTGLSLEASTKALRRASEGGGEGGFCIYDFDLEYVWIKEMAKFQIGSLKPDDKRVKGIKNSLANIPSSCCFLYDFYQKYGEKFYLQEEAKSIAPCKALTKPLRSHEHEHDHEHEQDQPKKHLIKSDQMIRFDRSRFDQFWDAYPRKVEKAESLKIWKSKNIEKHLPEILNDLKQRSDWSAKNPFTPYPTTYLNGKRWEDEQKISPVVIEKKKETILEKLIREEREKGETNETEQN